MQPHSSTTPFGRRSLTLAHVASQADREGAAAGKGRAQMASVSRDLRREDARRRFGARAGGAGRAAELSPGDDFERRGPGRVPLKSATRAKGARHGAGDACGGIWRRWSTAASSFAGTAQTASASPAKGRAASSRWRSASISARWWRAPRSSRPGPRRSGRKSAPCASCASASLYAAATSPR